MISLDRIFFVCESIKRILQLNPSENVDQQLQLLFNNIIKSSLDNKKKLKIWYLHNNVSRDNPLPVVLEKIGHIILRKCSDELIAEKMGFQRTSISQSRNTVINCFKNKKDHLWLNHIGGERLIPTVFSYLPLLKEFTCTNNQLISLPPEISKLVNLEKLDCSHNQIISLPSTIEQLRKLRNLNCSNNQIQSLPSFVPAMLTAGTKFNFSNNRIYACAPQLRREPNLELFGNPIIELSSSFTTTSTASERMGRVSELLNAEGRITQLLNLSAQRPLTFNEQVELNRLFEDPRSYVPPSIQSRPVEGLIPQEFPGDLTTLDLPTLKLNGPLWSQISAWIGILKISSDYSKLHTRAIVTARTLSILKLAEKNAEYRKSLVFAMKQASTTCADRATYWLGYCEIQKAILESGDQSIEQTIEIMKGAYALGLIEQYADEFIANHPLCDQIEVPLALMKKLKEEFKLPISIQEMSYFDYSKLGPHDIEAAKVAVRKKMQDRDAFVTFLIHEKAWTKKLEKDFNAEKRVDIASVRTECEDAMNILEERRMSMTNADYNNQSKALADRFNNAEWEWLKNKTEELCLPNLALTPANNFHGTRILIKCCHLPSDQALYIRGNGPGLSWERGIKLKPAAWDTFVFDSNAPFLGDFEYKLLINDNTEKWEDGNNCRATSGQTLTRIHHFNPNVLPLIKKSVLTLNFPSSEGQSLFLTGNGPLGNWDQKIPMQRSAISDDTWFISFDGQFENFSYKVRRGDAWEQGENRLAQCGRKVTLKTPIF